MSSDIVSRANALAFISLESYLRDWLPDGRREGNEWVARNPTRSDSRPGSFKVNLKTCVWRDFAISDKGGNDPVSLYRYLRGLPHMTDAAREILGEPFGAKVRAGNLPPRAPQRPPQDDFEAVLPIPDDAPPAPPKSRATRFEFRTRDGALAFFVDRFEAQGDRKKFFTPRSLWRNKRNNTFEWRNKRPPGLLPLYGAHLLPVPRDASRVPSDAGQKTPVLLVEGEKTRDLAARISPIPVVTWHGGAENVATADWEALRGLRIYLWPDADGPGHDAMDQIGKALRAIDPESELYFVPPPENAADGWDLGDAVAEGWDRQALAAYLRNRRRPWEPRPDPVGEPLHIDNKQTPLLIDNRPAPAELERADPPDTQFEPDGAVDEWRSGAHGFKFLGFAGSTYFYLPFNKKQVTALSTSQHTKLNLLSLMPLPNWKDVQGAFLGDSTASRSAKRSESEMWDLTASEMLRISAEIGTFDARRIRGRGAWLDRGRIVYHCGDVLIVDGKPTPIGKFKSEFIYQQEQRIRSIVGRELSDEAGQGIIDVFRAARWANPIYADLVAGWAALAPICGAFDIRPHLWITGVANSGKSTIFKLIGAFVDGIGYGIQSNSTEAGIRQTLKSDALPVYYDEAEGEKEKDRDRLRAIIEFCRVSFTDSNTLTVKGTAGGEAVAFHPRSMFALGSIAVNLVNAADKQRFVVCHLRGAQDVQADEAKWKAAEKRFHDLNGNGEIGQDLAGRCLSLIPIIRESIATLYRIGLPIIGHQRRAHMYAHLMAGLWHLTHRTPIDEASAAEQMARCKNIEEPDTTQEKDQDSCLGTILRSQVRVDHTEGSMGTYTVGELIRYIIDFDRGQLPAGDSNIVLRTHGDKALRRIGIICTAQSVTVANKSDFLKRALTETIYANNYANILLHLKDAKRSEGAVYFGGFISRGIIIPADSLGI